MFSPGDNTPEDCMVPTRNTGSIPRRRDGLLRQAIRAARVLATMACACLLMACASRDTQPQPSTTAPAARHHTVALLGATGMVGEYLLQEALARGLAVRALARDPSKLAHYGSRITVVKGDARDLAAVTALLRGSDAVVSAIGPVRADGAAARSVNTDATRTVIQAMQQQGIARYVVVSGAAIEMPGDERDLLGWWIQALARVALPDAVKDKQAEYALLADSTLDWTLVRCPLIDAAPFRQPVEASLYTPPAFRVRAGELARFVIDQVDADEFVRAGPFVGSRQAIAYRGPDAG